MELSRDIFNNLRIILKIVHCKIEYALSNQKKNVATDYKQYY